MLLPAAAAPAAVNNFAGNDGDQLSGSNCLTDRDWECVPDADVLGAQDPSGPSDDSFAGGSKEFEPDQWSFVAEEVPAKADLKGVWSVTPTGDDGRTYLYAAFLRAANTGDTYLGIELNQKRTTWVNSLGAEIPCRTDGDVLISYATGSSPTVTLHEWTGTGPAECPDGATGVWESRPALTASVEAAINHGGPIANHLDPDVFGDQFGKSLFGEAALDLRAVADAVQYSSACEYFRQLSVKSRSSSGVNSSLQDWVLASQVVARSCETPGGGGDTGGGGGGGDTGGGEPDTTPPAAPTLTSPSAGALSCGSTVSMAGEAEPGSTVIVYDGGAPVGLVEAASDGSWSLALENLSDGVHQLRADATDAAGNSSSLSAPVDVTVDTTAPAAPVLQASAPADNTVVLTGTTEPGASVEILQDGVHVITLTADGAGEFGETLTVDAGDHTYVARASDGCRTSDDSAAQTVTVTGASGTGDGGSGTGDGGTGTGDGGTGDGGTGTGDGGTGTGDGGTGTGDGGTGTGDGGTGTGDSGTGGGTGDSGTGTGSSGSGTGTGSTGTGSEAAGVISEVTLGAGVTEVQSCALKPFKAYVRRKKVRKVKFMVDGKVVRKVRKKDRFGRFVGRIDPTGLKRGPHVLTAKLIFRKKLNRKPKLLMLRFRRCDQCISRRSFKIRIKHLRKGERAVKAIVKLNGKRIKVIRGKKRLKARVHLKGLPKGTYRVKVRAKTNRGRWVTDRRKYRTCVGKDAPVTNPA